MGIGLARWRVGCEFDDTIMLVAQAHFAGAQQHAVAGDAADLAHLQHRTCRGDDGTRRGKHRAQPGPRVGCAADDARDPCAGIDLADAQPVGVGVLHRLQNMCHAECRQRRAGVGDALQLETDAGQPVRDGVQRCIGVEVGAQPAERELHAWPPFMAEGASRSTDPGAPASGQWENKAGPAAMLR